MALAKPDPVARKGYSPQCPECGNTRSLTLACGWSEPDDDFLRYRACENCGERFATVEVVIPTSSFYRLDYRGRIYRRLYWRRRLGKGITTIPAKYHESDLLKVIVSVTPWRKRAQPPPRSGPPQG